MYLCCFSRNKQKNGNREIESPETQSTRKKYDSYSYQQLSSEQASLLQLFYIQSEDYEQDHQDKIDKPALLTKQCWLRLIHIKTPQTSPQDQIKISLQQGIPDEMRPGIWIWISRAEVLREKHSNQLYSKLKQSPSNYDTQIFKEVQTFLIRSNQEDKLDLFFDVLRAYANYDTELGFKPSMIPLANIILKVMQPEQYENQQLTYAIQSYKLVGDFIDSMSFWILVSLMYSSEIREVYKKDEVFSLKLANELKHHYSELTQHVKDLGVKLNHLYQQPLLTEILNASNTDLQRRIIDIVLFEGQQSINRIFLKLLSHSEEVLFFYKTKEDFLIYVQQNLISAGIKFVTKGENYEKLFL